MRSTACIATRIAFTVWVRHPSDIIFVTRIKIIIMRTRKFTHIAADVALKLVIGFLTTLAIGGILAFIGLWIAGEIDPSNATFGYMG